jgi:signal peptidase I
MKIFLTTITILTSISGVMLVNYYSIKIFRVVSPSMEPIIHKDSIIVVKQDIHYKTGDIVTYKTLRNTHPFTHRIINIFKINDKYYFNFKGDANETKDPYPVLESEIIGKYVFSIPYLGKVSQLFREPKTLFILLSIPIGLVSGKMFKRFLFVS